MATMAAAAAHANINGHQQGPTTVMTIVSTIVDKPQSPAAPRLPLKFSSAIAAAAACSLTTSMSTAQREIFTVTSNSSQDTTSREQSPAAAAAAAPRLRLKLSSSVSAAGVASGLTSTTTEPTSAAATNNSSQQQHQKSERSPFHINISETHHSRMRAPAVVRRESTSSCRGSSRIDQTRKCRLVRG
jgi:hypothetical protein